MKLASTKVTNPEWEALLDKGKKLIPTLLKRWQKKLGVQTEKVIIKKMKTKWGTCNSDDRRIWLNLELAKKPMHCLNYVFVHELCHLIEKKHSDRFTEVLENALPNWKHYKDELNHSTLSYWKWEC
jgi:predicted metal-dependent hydrolase